MSSVRTESAPLKRKRDVGVEQENAHLPETIILKSASTECAIDSQQVQLIPKILVPRDYLPLAFTKRAREYQPSLFRAHLKVLEEQRNETSRHIERVLIAKSTVNNDLFAVERVQAGVYGLCPLHDWIALDELDCRLSKRPRSDFAVGQKRLPESAPWWDRAAASVQAMRQSSSLPEIPKLSMTRHPEASVIHIIGRAAKGDASGRRDPDEVEKGILPQESSEQTPTTDSIIEAFRAKYLEALYISRTSLTYFAKGPLARARTFFQEQANAAEGPFLSSTLQEMIMSITVSDKKYSTTLPDLIKEIPCSALEDEQDVLKQTQAMCKKGKKRKKLNKAGLFPFEEEHVVQWWLQKEKDAESADPNSTSAERIKSVLARQRTRETQLQIMLILEIMSNQLSRMEKQNDSSINQSTAKSEQNGEDGKRVKRSIDLQSVLDILVDRLCIWQTTQNEFDAVEPLLGSQSGQHSSRGNVLQDFCTEVLVPFFSARVPRIFAQLCRKMGTIGVTSPARPAIQRVRSATQSQLKPGLALSRRNLQRVSTDGNIARERIPALTRSVTDSSTLKIKRENADILLEDVPSHRPRPQPNYRYAQREVDLNALTKATEDNLKRKALVEQELKSAINVLKKPNSRMAVKEYVESVEGRISGKSKRKREPQQSNAAPSPLVKATPRTNRVYRGSAQNRPISEIVVPPSSEPRVPSSSHRATASEILRSKDNSIDNRLGIQSTPSKKYLVAATPSRGGNRCVDRRGLPISPQDGSDDDDIAVSPDLVIKSSYGTTRTPSRSHSRLLHSLPESSLNVIAMTPARGIALKAEVQLPAEDCAPTRPTLVSGPLDLTLSTSVKKEEECDVYKTLGWDDEDIL